MANPFKTIVAVVAAAAGVTATVLVVTTDDQGDPVEEIQVPENVVADRHVVHNGKMLRVVGAKIKMDKTVADTAVGRSIEADPDPDMQCNIIFQAEKAWRKYNRPYETLPEGEPIPEGYQPVEYFDTEQPGADVVPKIPELYSYFQKTTPVLAASTPIPPGDFMWYWMGVGDGCLAARDSAAYKASSMQEALLLNTPIKEKIFRVEGTCQPVAEESPGEPPGDPYQCWVPWGDPRANPDPEIMIPHNWGNLERLNFVRGRGDKANRRYKLKE